MTTPGLDPATFGLTTQYLTSSPLDDDFSVEPSFGIKRLFRSKLNPDLKLRHPPSLVPPQVPLDAFMLLVVKTENSTTDELRSSVHSAA
ncbi:hypothetical protein PF003_g21479 [Phytophthora fragariae]|nr:hypothetical protein PF003_g21479 [Phytophthora fragariae]